MMSYAAKDAFNIVKRLKMTSIPIKVPHETEGNGPLRNKTIPRVLQQRFSGANRAILLEKKVLFLHRPCEQPSL